MSRTHAEYLTQAVSIADLPALIDAHYPDARVFSGPKNRLKAVWRGGDDYSVSLKRGPDGWFWKDFKTEQGGNAYTWLVTVAGYEKRDAAELLLAEAGFATNDPVSRLRARARVQSRRRDASKAAQTEAQQKAANVARDLASWSDLDPTGSSDYLTRKGLPTPHGVRFGRDKHGSFVALRLFNEDGPVGLQRIYDDGGKKFTWGLKKTGAYVVVAATARGLKVGGLPNKAKHLYVAEGFATAASVCLASGEPVVVAFDKGNLGPVVSMLRRRVGTPSRLAITIAADNDRWKADELHQGMKKGNPGLEAAHRVALARSCRVVAPSFRVELCASKPTDFNDLHVLGGLERLRAQLTYAILPQIDLAFADDLRKYDKKLRDIGATTGRYLPAIEQLPEGVTVIRAPQGTGKTYVMEEQVRKALDASQRVIYLTHRTSLANAAAVRLGVECYDAYSAAELRQISSATMCVNSLYKLRRDDGTVEPFDMIILDESEQFARALSGKHIASKRLNLDVLEVLMQRADQLVFMDADIGSMTRQMLREWRPREKTHRINHHYAVGAGKTIYIHSHPGAVYDAALSGPTFVATNSRKESERFDAFLTKHGSNGKLVNGETSFEQHDFMANINEQSRHLDHLAMSPSGSTGLSIDHDRFERVCGIFYRNVGTPEDVVQAISRVRKAKTYHLWLDPVMASDAIDLDARYGVTLDKEQELLGVDLTEGHESNDTYTTLKKLAQQQIQRGRVAYRMNVLRLLALQGYTIEIVDDREDEQFERYKSLQKEARELGDRRYAENRLNAPVLDTDQADALQSSWELTTLDRYALDRYNLTSFYVADPYDYDEVKQWLERDRRGQYRQQIESLEYTLSPTHQLADLAKQLIEQRDFVEDLPLLATRQHFYQQVLKAVGFERAAAGEEVRYRREDESIQTLTAWIEENRTWLAGVISLPSKQKLDENIIRYIGTWLRQLGLNHRRIGKNAKGTYTLRPESVRETLGVIEKRGTIPLENIVSSRNVPDSKKPEKLVPDDTPEVIHKLLERLMRGELPDEVATRTQDLLRLAESDEAKSFEGLIKLAEREGITDR
ncbi:MAG: plasmid replication protein, CyRepA1 family [Trueperaceae bacterium]|nr:plasmid replication protein, CyRepA1 family [Trueperaceae bacterium]MDZ7705528.1 plasmid replication protein, CyRepA1 family [Trueperaceae bacterium]